MKLLVEPRWTPDLSPKANGEVAFDSFRDIHFLGIRGGTVGRFALEYRFPGDQSGFRFSFPLSDV